MQVHFSNQDVDPACNGLHRIMRNSLCNNVTVPRYVLLPGSKKTPSSNNKNYKQSQSAVKLHVVPHLYPKW